MATIRQKKLAKAAIENLSKDNPLNKQELVASVGYSEIVADKKATEILNSKGVVEELANFGLTEEFIKTALVEDIKGKPRRRIKELELGADLLKLREPGNKGGSVNIQINVQNFGDKHTAPISAKTVPADRIGSNR